MASCLLELWLEGMYGMKVKVREGELLPYMQCNIAYGSPAVPVMLVPFALGMYARRCQAEGFVPQVGEQHSDSGVSAGSKAEPLAGYF